jgi:hypothetical protein
MMGRALSAKDRNQLKDFLAEHSRKGATCAECDSTFSVDSGDGKRVAIFPNGAGGLAFYVLCRPCGSEYEKRGKAAIPNVSKDSLITALMSEYAPKGKAPVWIH